MSSARPFLCCLPVLLVTVTLGPALAEEPDANLIAQGERLVSLLDCGVCHTPKAFTAQGPRPDPARWLSGHPQDEKLPAIPAGVGDPAGWGGVFNHSLTAWAGPWGTSYATNLTPDTATGIGEWTEEIFGRAIRTGMHVEEERPFLPPMPTYAHLSDEEVHAMFVYLRSLTPVSNDVPGSVMAKKPPQNP